MAKLGRKTKLTPELQKKVCEIIKAGNYAKTACILAGISESTFYSWKKQGMNEKSGKYLEFLESIKKAEKFAEAYFVQLIREAAENSPMNWKAAAWLLERRNPDEWGNINKMAMKHEGKMKLKTKTVNVFNEIDELEKDLNAHKKKD